MSKCSLSIKWIYYRNEHNHLFFRRGNTYGYIFFYQNNVFLGFIEIYNTIKHKINSKYKLSTICNRNNAETNVQTALVVFSIIILVILRDFLF